MCRALLILAFALCVCSVNVFAQDASQRTRDLVAALDKSKYKKKEKRDFKIEIYVDVKNEAVFKANPAEYSGLYQSLEPGYSLQISVGQDGSATGSGYDSTIGTYDSHTTNFTLKDARVEGALLTATKVYDSGQTEKLEAVFANRTVLRGTNPNAIAATDRRYGIGFIQSQAATGTDKNATWTNRVFLEFRK